MFNSYIVVQEKGWGNEHIIRKSNCFSSPEEETEIKILGKWFIEKGSEVRRSGQSKALSKDVTLESDHSLIPPRSQGTNDTTELST